jgi:hypothetical protein
MVALPTSIIKIQKFSWRAGQWYFVRTRVMMTEVIVEDVDAILEAEIMYYEGVFPLFG